MIKFYNPFKPHVAHQDGIWVVRRFGLLWWEYLDRDGAYWWGLGNGSRWYPFYSEADAVARLRKITVKHPVITSADLEPRP